MRTAAASMADHVTTLTRGRRFSTMNCTHPTETPRMLRPLAIVLSGLLPAAVLAADGPTIVDAAGKEIVLTKWKIAAGTRPLNWLAKEGPAPEALAFRETNSTTFKEGVLTFIPLERLESLTY